MKHKKFKAKGYYTYEYISKVKGQGRQYRHTADLNLGPGSGLRKYIIQEEKERERDRERKRERERESV